MPVTPVAQIPYPNLSDKPLIPDAVKALALQADSWVSGMDSALSARIAAVGSRVTAVNSRLSTTSTNLAASNTSMSAGDTAITNAQNSLTSVESRLTTQDATANTLQARYNTDNTNLSQFQGNTPSGVLASALGSLSLNISAGDQNVYWLRTTFVANNTGRYVGIRILYNGTYSVGSGGNTLEWRICWADGNTTPLWANYMSQNFVSGVDSAARPFTASGFTLATPSLGTTIGLGVKGYGSSYTTYINTFSIQYMTEYR